MNNIEIWKDIKDWEGLYEISNLGRIKFLKRTYQSWNYRSKSMVNITRKEKIMKSCIKEDGYCHINLSIGKRESCYLLHRLLAQHFLPNPLNLAHVHHIDNNRANYKLENLMWVTQKDNNRYTVESNGQKRPDGNKNRYKAKVKINEPIPEYFTNIDIKLDEKQVLEIRELYSKGYSMYKLAKIYGVQSNNISAIVKRKTWKYI